MKWILTITMIAIAVTVIALDYIDSNNIKR